MKKRFSLSLVIAFFFMMMSIQTTMAAQPEQGLKYTPAEGFDPADEMLYKS